jgi:hypothetical protein
MMAYVGIVLSIKWSGAHIYIPLSFVFAHVQGGIWGGQ